MGAMILKMTAATLLHIAVTALVYVIWRKQKNVFSQKQKKATALKLCVGLFYGLCCIASNHLGIDYGSMLVNVRDIAPLAAGLFFSPISGILAGLIGGIERFLVGEFLDIGSFTRVACGLSTVLAGVLAAVMHRWIYEGKRPAVFHAFNIGAVTEVFHMYVVLLTNRDQFDAAYYVIRICSFPMIIFTALGMAGCSLAVLFLSHERKDWRPQPREKTPVFTHFQRGLMIVIILLFVFSTLTGSAVQSRLSREKAKSSLESGAEKIRVNYESLDRDPEALEDMMASWSMNAGDYLAGLIDMEHREVRMLYSGTGPHETLTANDLLLIKKNVNGDAFYAQLDLLPFESLNLSVALPGGNYLLMMYDAGIVRSESRFLLYDTVFSNILIFATLYVLISLMVENTVVRSLKRVNTSLDRITEGHLEETVSARSSLEFSELSDGINKTVTALRGYIEDAKQRMAHDLKMAADIQEAALPRNFDFNRNDFRIYALMDPAKEVGGDFYDFFFIDNDTLALVIADVSGKSVPAAMFMMRSKTAIKNFSRVGKGPGEVLASVNNTLCEGNDANMFVSVWLGIIDLRTGRMRCANAGHEYPVVMRAGQDYAYLKDKHGLVLAVMNGIRMSEYELQMEPGDRLFVYTDGVPEAINEQEEAYGADRLGARLNVLKDATERETLMGVLQDVEAFKGGAEQFDDITMLGFTYLGPESD